MITMITACVLISGITEYLSFGNMTYPLIECLLIGILAVHSYSSGTPNTCKCMYIHILVRFTLFVLASRGNNRIPFLANCIPNRFNTKLAFRWLQREKMRLDYSRL